MLTVVLVLTLIVLAAEHRHRRLSNGAIKTLAESEEATPKGGGP